MFVFCKCWVLSGRGLCDELITRPEESSTDCGASLCVIWKPRERGLGPVGAAAPKRNKETNALLRIMSH